MKLLEVMIMDNNQEKAVIITGGSGFIGSNVAKLFVESGFNVILSLIHI